MADWEEKLPPIARERLAKAGDLTPEDKDRLRDLEELEAVLSDFYQERLDSEGLWHRLRGYRDISKGSLLGEAQRKLVRSIVLATETQECRRRRDAILAVETLKAIQNTAVIEMELNSIESLLRAYKGGIERTYAQLNDAVEHDPQRRLQRVQQGQQTMIVQLTVDEAVKQSPEWRDFLSNHERRYGEQLDQVVARLEGQLAQ